MPFNFNAKQVFLTYAQCNLDKTEVYDHFNTFCGVAEYIVAREKHEDGGLHLHCYFKFKSQIHTRDERYFDIKGFHPNIATVTSAKARERIKKYCIKDGDYIANVEVLGKRLAMLTSMLEEGLTPKFVKQNPEMMTMNFSSIMSWYRFVTNKPVQRKELPKRRHIWLYGVRNTGKSTWLWAYLSLVEKYEEIPKNNDWSGIDESVDTLYFDEFKGQLTVQMLNSLCDGSTKLNTKGGSTRISQPRIIICSNFRIETCYHNCDQIEFDALNARFIQYDAAINRPPLPRSIIE